MEYEPTVWQDGDTITSARLNKIEEGIAENSGGTYVVECTITSDDTPSEPQ